MSRVSGQTDRSHSSPPKTRLAKGLAIVVVVAGVAWVMGTNLGDWVIAENHEENALRRQIHTAELLEHMGTIKVGEPMPDFEFLGLDGNYWKLSELAESSMAIVFFDYHCDNCLKELREINAAIKNGLPADRIVMITCSNPILLMDLWDSLAVPCKLLYDEERVYTSSIQMYTYPFSVFVDQDLVIRRVTAGIVSSGEYADILLN